MHHIPDEILELFRSGNIHKSAMKFPLTWLFNFLRGAESDPEEALMTWLTKYQITELSCANLQVKPNIICLIAACVAKSNVHTVDFSRNQLGEHGPAVAANLTRKGSQVHTVNFSYNDLREHGPATALYLTREGSQVHTVDFSINELRKHGPAVAANLIHEGSRVHTVNFSQNTLRKHGPAVAANLTRKGSQVHTVNFNCNSFGEHGPAVAANLTREGSQVHTVNFRDNHLREHGPAVAANLTREGSEVHTVDFSYNHLREHGPAVAASLVREGSRVRTVNFGYNEFGRHAPAVAANLTCKDSQVHTVKFGNYGIREKDVPAVQKCLTNKHSKIICARGVGKFTSKQLNNNAFNLFFSRYTKAETLQEASAKSFYQKQIKRITEYNEPPQDIMRDLMTLPESMDYCRKSLLHYQGILTKDDILNGKENEVEKCYIEQERNKQASLP